MKNGSGPGCGRSESAGGRVVVRTEVIIIRSCGMGGGGGSSYTAAELGLGSILFNNEHV